MNEQDRPRQARNVRQHQDRIRQAAEQAATEAIAALGGGEIDHHLIRQLHQLDRNKTAIERLSMSQKNALCITAMQIHQARGEGEGGAAAFMDAFLFGFQLGHDYAIEHGQILEDS